MPDAARRTDLFKALNHFMVMLNVHVPSGEADVEMVVGDTAFRALSDAMDAAPHMAAKFYGDKFVLKVPSGRVVIRKRPAKTEVFPCGFRSPEGYACMKHEGHAFEHVVGDAASEETRVSADLKTYSARQSREAQLEREKTSVLAALKEPKTRSGPVTYVGQPCLHSVYGKGVCLLAEGHTPDHDFGSTSVPPEETKPPARAHLKGCTLDTTHEGACYGPSLLAGLAGLKEPKTRAEPTFGVSPRQALGEALACVERARNLLGAVTHHLSGGADRAQAGNTHDRIVSILPALRELYEAAK